MKQSQVGSPTDNDVVCSTCCNFQYGEELATNLGICSVDKREVPDCSYCDLWNVKLTEEDYEVIAGNKIRS